MSKRKDDNEMLNVLVIGGLAYLAYQWWKKKQLPAGTVTPGDLQIRAWDDKPVPYNPEAEPPVYQDFDFYQEYKGSLAGGIRGIGVPLII